MALFNTRGELETDFQAKGTTRRYLGGPNDDFNSFIGGTRDGLISDLGGQIDLAPFLKQKEKFMQSDLISKLRTKGALGKPKRKRFMSAHDGEWNPDRKWELKPFQDTRRVRRLNRTIRIACDFSINCGTKAEDINRYGAMVWALAEIIENAGIQVEVIYESKSKGCDKRGGRVVSMFFVHMKKPGEYMAPQNLAALFTSNFYRRLGFAFTSLAPAVVGDLQCTNHAGVPQVDHTPIQFKDGVLRLSPKAPLLRADAVEEAIMQAIT